MSNVNNSNEYNHKGRGRVGGFHAGQAVAPCRIPQRIHSSSRSPKPNKGMYNQTKNAENTRPSTRTRPQSVESPRSSDQNEFGGGKARSAVHTKHLSFGKSVSKVPKKPIPMSETTELLNQEAIRKREEQELQGNGSTTDDLGSLDRTCDVHKMKMSWDDKICRFEKLKSELGQRQKSIMQLYITLKSSYKMMTSLGQKVELPPVDELYIMNVAKMEPDQLLQLCTIGKNAEDALAWRARVDALNMNIDKLSELPEKLMTVSELILTKRKQIIDWFDAIKTEEKGIAMSKLTKKINEFNAEHGMLNSSLQNCKMKFVEDVRKFVNNIRLGMDEVLSMQLRTEDLMFKLRQISSENADLRKQIQSNKNMKLQNNKAKIEELQKELKDEKAKKALLKDRMFRADGQTKIANEHVTQLEAALDMARSQNWSLERTVKQLSDQNQKLQMDFETELSKLTESIQENTKHLEEIAEAREKLQVEKELLQKRLDGITENNNKTIQNLQQDFDTSVANLMQTEQKLMAADEAKANLEAKVETLSEELLKLEQSHKDLLSQVQGKDEQICNLTATATELNCTKKELENAYSEITQLKETMLKQSMTIEEIEHNFREMSSIEKTLQSDLSHKENYIVKLENKVADLEKEIYESNHKMQDYEHRVKALKSDIEQMQQDLGEYKDIGELRELINQQQTDLEEATRQNGELVESLQQKERDLKRNIEHLAQQEAETEQKNAFIKMLSAKEEEQVNIIKLLQHNLEIRTHADVELSQQVAEKSAEVTSLVNGLDSRKQQISQLEKIILTLEDQLRKVYAQRRKDQEKITILEKALNENDLIKPKHTADVPTENLDNLIKILEEELGEPEPTKKRLDKMHIDRKRLGSIECPADDVFLKDSRCSKSFNMQEKIERKKAMLHMEMPKLPVRIEPIYNLSDDKNNGNSTSYASDVPIVQMLNTPREDKKRKMFKFAGHKF